MKITIDRELYSFKENLNFRARENIDQLTYEEVCKIQSYLEREFPVHLTENMLDDWLSFETETIADILGYNSWDEILERESYFVYKFGDETFTEKWAGAQIPKVQRDMFRRISKLIAFDDCADVSVEKIVYLGREVHYTGWQPEMKMSYAYDKRSLDICWEDSFPEWDH